MFGWFNKKIEKTLLSGRERELRDLLQTLRGDMEDDKRGLLALNAAMARNALEARPNDYGFLEGGSLLHPHTFYEKNKNCCAHLTQMLKDLKRANPLAAASFMPWLYTLQAVEYKELRPLMRDVWAEIARGFPFVERVAAENGTAPALFKDYDRIPQGF